MRKQKLFEASGGHSGTAAQVTKAVEKQNGT